MIFSPFAYRHRHVTFHFISPLQGRFSFLGLSHIWISKWMLWFNFSLHVAYFSLPFVSFAPVLLCILRMVRWWVSIIFLFKKETLIISLGFFSCSSCATENTRTHIYTGTHILNSLRYDVYPGNENEIERENDVCTLSVRWHATHAGGHDNTKQSEKQRRKLSGRETHKTMENEVNKKTETKLK